MGCHGIQGEGGFFFYFFIFMNQGREDLYALSYPIFFVKTKNVFCWTKSLHRPKEPEIFVLGGLICVINLLIYTNFHTYTQTQVNIVKSLKLHVS